MLKLVTEPKGLTLSMDGVRILDHSQDLPCVSIGSLDLEIEVRHGMYRILRDQPRWKKALREARVISAGPSRVELDFSGLLRLVIEEEADCARMTPVPTGLAGLAGLAGGENVNWMSLGLPLPRGEPVLGAGEQLSHVDLRGKRLPMWTTEPGVGRGMNYAKLLADIHSGRGGSREHVYYPQPSFVTSGGVWALVSSTAFGRMDFRHKDRCEAETYEIPGCVRIGKARDAGEAAARIGSLLGKQPALPRHFHEGLVLGAQGGTEVVRAKLDAALGAGIPVTALWCQDWQGIRMTPYGKQLFWNWSYDRTLYPDLPGFIGELHDRGIRFMGYNNPFLSTDAPLHAEGARLGHFVRKRDGTPYETSSTTFPVSPVDLFNPDARAWYKSIIRENMIGIGMDGWMADFGEYLPPDGVIGGHGRGGGVASSLDPYRAHNRYPVEWAATNAEAVLESGRALGGEDGELGRPITFFCRSGFSGSTEFAPLIWAGDQAVNFMRDFGMPAALAAGVSSAMSGIGYWHFDIGGFFSYAWIKRSRELLMRSCEFAAFTQVMRTHEGINPPVNAQFDSDAGMLGHFARMTRLHAALAPYHRYLSERYQETGIPPIAPVLLNGRGGGRALRVSADQYMYGPDLLVAPVFRGGARSRRVELPEGVWLDFWTGREAAGRAPLCDAPLGSPPVFFRRGSVFTDLFGKAAQGGTHERQH